jgi:HlyD family secretion protein
MRVPPVLGLLAFAGIAGGAYLYWSYQLASRTPPGLAVANGRIEVQRVDISAKIAGRVAEIRVREGDFVKRDTLVARLDTAELRAQLAAAKAQVQRAVASIGRAEAEIAVRQADHNLSEIELQRAIDLEQRAAGTKADLERRTAQHAVAEAQIRGAEAALTDAKAAKALAEAQVEQIEATLMDMDLKSSVSGRIEYRLVQPGEVVGPGGRLLTMLDLTDVFMTIFLPTGEAGKVALRSEARIVLDALPNYVFPATVSFVAAEAQFTPKTVETANEREKLMYRVKLVINSDLIQTYQNYVKSGLTGNAYVKIAPDLPWPPHLTVRLPNVSG